MGCLLLTWLLAIAALAAAQHAPTLRRRCAAARINVHCGSHKGIFWRVGGGRFQRATTADGFKPVSAPSDAHTMVIVCNFGDIKASAATRPLTKPVVPTLLRDVGARATVSVVIFNSANVDVASGHFLHRANLNRLHQGVPALVGTVLNGTIGTNATIAVRVEKSANVRLQKGTMLFSRDAHLVAPMIKDGAAACVSACVDVELVESANVVGQGEQTRVLLSNAHLLSRVFNASCLNGGRLFVDIRESASVRDVDSLVMGKESTLASKLVRIGASSNDAVFSLGVADAVEAKVNGALELRGGMLFEGALETADVQQGLLVLLRMENVANAAAGRFSAPQGTNIGELVSLSKAVSCRAVVFLSRCASITATFVGGVKAIASIVTFRDDAEHTTVNATLLKSANIVTDKSTVREGDSLLNKVIIGQGKVLGGRYVTFVVNMANLRTESASGSAFVVDGVFVNGLVDLGQHATQCKVEVFAKQVANILCSGQGTGTLQMGAKSKLLGHAVQLQGSDVTVRTKMEIVSNTFIPMTNMHKLNGDLIEGKSAFKLLELRESFVSQHFKCDAASLIDVLTF